MELQLQQRRWHTPHQPHKACLTAGPWSPQRAGVAAAAGLYCGQRSARAAPTAPHSTCSNSGWLRWSSSRRAGAALCMLPTPCRTLCVPQTLSLRFAGLIKEERKALPKVGGTIALDYFPRFGARVG